MGQRFAGQRCPYSNSGGAAPTNPVTIIGFVQLFLAPQGLVTPPSGHMRTTVINLAGCGTNATGTADSWQRGRLRWRCADLTLAVEKSATPNQTQRRIRGFHQLLTNYRSLASLGMTSQGFCFMTIQGCVQADQSLSFSDDRLEDVGIAAGQDDLLQG